MGRDYTNSEIICGNGIKFDNDILENIKKFDKSFLYEWTLDSEHDDMILDEKENIIYLIYKKDDCYGLKFFDMVNAVNFWLEKRFKGLIIKSFSTFEDDDYDEYDYYLTFNEIKEYCTIKEFIKFLKNIDTKNYKELYNILNPDNKNDEPLIFSLSQIC